MSNRNATASWSGYSHQGQVGLLIALRQIQQTANLDTHFVQFETHEDVAIYELQHGGNKRYISVHQVKAYYSAGNHLKNTYSDVLNGNFENGEAKFLHTAVEINNWDDQNVQNNNNVSLYIYSQNPLIQYCGTSEIENYIKAELRIILQSTEPLIENAYHRLSFELDSKIRIEHQKASKALFDINFSLQEIDDLIRSQEQFQKKELLDSRKLFYQTFIEVVSDDGISQERIDLVQNSIIRDINSISDEQFLLFLQLLNLNESWENLQSTQVNFNKTGLEQVFFNMLLNVINCSPKIDNNSSVGYLKSPNTSKFVLTSIVAEKHKARKVVENIIKNLKSQHLLWENHILINREIDADLTNDNPSIGRINTVYNEESDSKKFMSFSKSKLMNREEAFNILNHE